MKETEEVFKRFGFSLPNDYIRFHDSGVLINDPAVGLWMSRFRWLSPKEIATCFWPSWKIKPLIPCAKTMGGDHFCWFVSETGGSWIADCPADYDLGEGFAPTFESFVFRSMLDEFADSWWVEDLHQMNVVGKAYAQRVGCVMRPQWAQILSEVASRTPVINQWKHPQLLCQEEALEIVISELAFPMLGKEFQQHVLQSK